MISKGLKHVLLMALAFLAMDLQAQQTIQHYLSGKDKDHTVRWEFFCTEGRNSGKWTTIQVPSNWELQGFGGYNYGHSKNKSDEEGLYRHVFAAAKSWKGKNISIVFEGSMTDTEVKINGKLAGPVHQGGFYRFAYDVSSLIRPGADNVLEVKVSKISANASVQKAEGGGDFWALGGIYRPVYLEIKPRTSIDRVAIDARADGSFAMDVYLLNPSRGHSVEAQLQRLDGQNVGAVFTTNIAARQQKASLTTTLKDPALWSPEFPDLYQVVVSLRDSRGVVHRVTQRFGFRTVEVRPRDGIYVNDKKVIFKGVNRHSMWPESGRTLSKEISLLDVKLMKEMNMNAVRMSHYPPDQHFLDVCDSLGLFVLDELTGWQAKYDTEPGRKLVKELVIRDVNHPSIVLWANGNEGGWNTALDDDFWLYDIQQRFVYHPWEKFEGTDTKHYPDYNYVVNSTLYGNDIFFPTEFMHGLYDGGHGAGLEDFWNLMLTHRYGAGGFLWAFHDEGVVRTDKEGMIDTHANNAPDGIVGPHREKEGSFYTIREIWSPIQITTQYIPQTFNGKLEVENRYLYTNLDQCSFTWKLVSFPSPSEKNADPRIDAQGDFRSSSLAPGEKGFLQLPLPSSWRKSDALYVTAYDPHRAEVFTWSWPIQSSSAIAERSVSSASSVPVEVQERDNVLVVICDGIEYAFDKTTGYLEKVTTPKSSISLSGGPAQAGVSHKFTRIEHRKEGDQYIVEPFYEGATGFNVRWTFTSGKAVQLAYSYSQKGEADFMGVTFQYPEEKITGMKWLGRGPYRVWKNRLKGTQFGIWEKKYNNTVTGESWIYPEFKGYHDGVYWVEVQTTEASFTVYCDQGDATFLQMLRPSKPAGAYNDFTSPPFPEGNLSFLQAISPIGTKFQEAGKIGPQSQKNIMMNYTPVQGRLWFDFSAR